MPRNIYTIIILLFFIVSQINGIAQENNRHKFSLHGHEFISSSAVESAKIESVLFSKLSVGSTGQLVSKGLIVGDAQILSFTGSVLYSGANVSYKQKVNDWFGFYFELRFAGRLGTQIPTLLAEGVNTAVGSEIGWLFKLYEHEKGYLSGSIYTNRYSGSIISLTKFIEDVIDGNPNAKVIDKIPTSIIGARINYAHAFSRTWGAQFSGAYGYGEELRYEKKSGKLDLGLFVEANLYAEKNVPLGFGIGYNLTSMPAVIYNQEKFANIFYLNLAYTKASDFELGLEFQYYKVPLSNYSTDPGVFSPSLMMRFNF